MPKHTAKIVQDEDAPVPKDVLAQSIINISLAFNKLLASGLNEKAVIALIKDDTSLPKKTVATVLHSLMRLRDDYTND